MSDIGRIFIERSRAFLSHELFPRIAASVAELAEDDLWWRPNENSNSVGNLLLHLAGNTRQWIVSGVGGSTDERQRDLEFTDRGSFRAEEVVRRLADTVEEAAGVLARLDSSMLAEERLIQGRQVTVLGAIYHVVEHFSMHTGQIIYITKLRTGRDLHFYRTVDGVPRADWE
ncbi:MAG TPA: DinB family protein [Longimicrobiaceae bacterium]|nr:DinB family protein [Longimicrobiaceae bacterium]